MPKYSDSIRLDEAFSVGRTEQDDPSARRREADDEVHAAVREELVERGAARRVPGHGPAEVDLGRQIRRWKT
jgi:hypothetical protein